ncbi:hypothetical protein BD311DRAFT_85479 [Dichomitus squalens]|uniref:Secreted protein n=1 Tax=Dichomitus squalens TaxID=114155 RepID=A0A4Q9MC80_9APHY|nr:hypothetical protein BD311DRAFT_85479 [Dichomitus squalens]
MPRSQSKATRAILVMSTLMQTAGLDSPWVADDRSMLLFLVRITENIWPTLGLHPRDEPEPRYDPLQIRLVPMPPPDQHG